MSKARDILVYLSVKFLGDWDQIYEYITEKRSDIKDEDVKKAIQSIKSKYITIIDPEYPENLKNVYKPPFVLFYYGDISLIQDYQKCLSFVGSREYTEYGERMLHNTIPDLVKDYYIVSGLALGIDAISHQIAMDSGGKTIAVLGSGIECCYPPQNLILYQKIKNDHLLISEYPGDVNPSTQNFPKRNRLIAALSKGVVIAEGKTHSGTMITANVALECGREIMCFPYLANEDSGCNYLIKNGASLVETAEDIFEIVGRTKK